MNILKISAFMMLLTLSLTASAQKSKGSNHIGSIISTYMAIKDALAEDDGTTAKIKAGELYDLFASQPDKGLTHKQSKIIATWFDPLINNSTAISNTIVESEQRVSFAALSNALYNLLKGLKVNKQPLYRQYCPANNSYWLSNTKAIKNPYYNYSDKEMSKCGKTVATLPASR